MYMAEIVLWLSDCTRYCVDLSVLNNLLSKQKLIPLKRLVEIMSLATGWSSLV